MTILRRFENLTINHTRGGFIQKGELQHRCEIRVFRCEQTEVFAVKVIIRPQSQTCPPDYLCKSDGRKNSRFQIHWTTSSHPINGPWDLEKFRALSLTF